MDRYHAVQSVLEMFRQALLDRNSLRADVTAGITVALVLIPQSLAYAQLAGLPAYYGLYAALLPPIIGALFGSSPQLSTGPVALTSVLTAAVISPLAVPETAQFVSYAVALAFLSGVFQVGLGLMRLGVLVNLLSHPVLIGFVHAAVALIVLSQLPALLGMPGPATGHPLTDAWQTFLFLHDAHTASLAFAGTGIALLLLFRRYLPRWPGVLIVASLLTAVGYLLRFDDTGGRIVGEIPPGLPNFALPPLHLGAWGVLLPAAFAVALISFMEAMASAKLAAMRTGHRWQENRELIGQGLAKISAAVSQTMPVSGSFSRSALNTMAGARTWLAGVITAIFVLMTLLFFTPILKYLPQPVLAAIIVVALISLVDLKSVRNTWLASKDDSFSMLLTFCATLSLSPQIQNGVIVGILASLSLFIYRRMRPRVQVLEPTSPELKALLPPEAPLALAEQVAIVHFDASLFFVNASYFETAVLRLARVYPALKYVVIHAQSVNLLDATGVQMLQGLADGLKKNGVILVFVAVNGAVRYVLQRTGLVNEIGEGNFFQNEDQALVNLAQRGISSASCGSNP